MIIVLACDTFSTHNNGTTISAQRLVSELRKKGHEVRVITTGEPGEGLYICPHYQHGLVSTLASWQGVSIGKPDDEVILKALEGADVVHCYMPFVLSKRVAKLAKQCGVACTAAFHCQPEDITYNLGMSSCGFMADFFYWALREFFYKKVNYIHCPSQFIADELEKNHYKGKRYVISNGISERFQHEDIPKIPQLKGKFCILMVGRLSKEKRQDVLIKACLLSKHAQDIQLILAGHGPKETKYRRMAQKLPNPAIFGFYSQEDLVRLINMCDLYVHASDVEIEAISCMEAFACGLVPVISKSNMSATPQFALCENSLFKRADAQDLANKIDYWIEHPEEKKAMAQKYIESSAKYRLDDCVNRMIDMFREASSASTVSALCVCYKQSRSQCLHPQITSTVNRSPHSYRARDVRRLVRQKKRDGFRNVLHTAHSPQGDPLDYLLLVLDGALRHIGVDESRNHHIAANLVSPHFLRDRTRIPHKCGLRCSVRRLTRSTPRTHDGANGHDASSSLFHHIGENRTRHRHRTDCICCE